METDACFWSGTIGAMLAQQVEDGTLRFIRTLQPHEQNYGAKELEVLGVV